MQCTARPSQLLLLDDVDVMLRWCRALAHEQALDGRPGLVEDVLDAAGSVCDRELERRTARRRLGRQRGLDSASRTIGQRGHDSDCVISEVCEARGRTPDERRTPVADLEVAGSPPQRLGVLDGRV